MQLKEFFLHIGQQNAPACSDPLNGYIQYITNYVGDEQLVRFCFDLMLSNIDFDQAERAQWSAVCPNFNTIQFKNLNNEDVVIPLNERMKIALKQAKETSQTNYIFENQYKLVSKISAIISLSTNLAPTGLHTFSDFYETVKKLVENKSNPSVGETRLCYKPWQEYHVGTQGEVLPCSQLPVLWNVEEVESSAKGIRHLQQSLLQGNLNSVCFSCKLKPVTSIQNLKHELETHNLQKEDTDVIATLISLDQIFKKVTLPPPHLRFRISGNPDERNFLYVGIHGALQMMAYVEKYDQSKEPSVLDWGCGCGRYSQNIMKKWPNYAYTGSDIDSEAIDWCKNNIAGGNFVVNNPHVPTPFTNQQFSAVIASSVMTHLDREQQSLWLKEIARILKPDGIFVASTLGFTAASQVSGLINGLKEKMQTEGIVDDHLDPALDGIAPDGYYRDVFQTEEYTRKHWSKYFEIKEYIHAGLTSTQDLVVLQKKKTNWFQKLFG